ncbi:hypothetical protein BC834DRAFT_970356 [Gloeopeniophorella convolvens]|nr:hypothetical protein BC834DRAFT_970356 [Gloeopeniophorella convolvens]
MRKLIPRLLNRLAQRSVDAEHVRPLRPPAQGQRSLRRPPPPPPVFFGRAESILLDEVNPITTPRAYRRHKSLPPQVTLPESQKTHTFSRDGTVEHDVRREMTAEERDWWANPYLRMLATPLRTCTRSKRYLPTDFLIRLSIKRLPSPRASANARPSHTIVPDGLQHPKFKNRDSGRGKYIVCRRAAVQDALSKPGSIARALTPPTALPAYIAHLLRLRVLQELELLAARLRSRPHHADAAPILRRLTQREFATLRAGRAPRDTGAVAVLVVPPLNRDPATGQRPAPHMSPLPEPARLARVSALPPSVLCRVSPAAEHSGAPDVLSPMRVPLYNGVPLFPGRGQRVALHARLCHVLKLERDARWRHGGGEAPPPAESEEGKPAKRRRGEVASHAFLLRSSADTVLRADTVPLAIALWRLRMWEGEDVWEHGQGTWGSVV